MQHKPYPRVALVILDGWGMTSDPAVSAVAQAHTPCFDQLWQNYPHTTLKASEDAVGLPLGQMGNSEVGHLHLGAGRIVYQELDRIGQSIRKGEITQLPVYQELIAYCKAQQRPLHLMGLVSDGGVHSSLAHLLDLIPLLAQANLPAVYIHAFTDGRDTAPHGGLAYIEHLEAAIAPYPNMRVVSVVGRYYAMDRDQRWGRTAKAWRMLVQGDAEHFPTAYDAIKASYDQGVTDEFIKPCIIGQGAKIQEGDAVWFLNFRTDRGRQLSTALSQKDFHEFGMHRLHLHFVTMTQYDANYTGIHVMYEKDAVANGLGQVLADAGKTQLRIAETEKYPHVTFFFNGGREESYRGESRIMVPSPKVATYDLQPEMSADGVCTQAIAFIEEHNPDFVCLNFANPDMVGHTGVFEAAVKACETVDACLARLADVLVAQGYATIILADHGNADIMRKPDGSPHTAHTLALVPCILLASDIQGLQLHSGGLADVAPTLLSLLGLPLPAEMKGNGLLELA